MKGKVETEEVGTERFPDEEIWEYPCEKCGAVVYSTKVAIRCSRVKFENGIAEDSPCDFALMSG